MLQRLVDNIAESMLPKSQCGIRRNSSTVDMIFTARQLQEKCREQHKDLFMAFVDLSKAFHTVQRNLLWDVLLHSGCTWPPVCSWCGSKSIQEDGADCQHHKNRSNLPMEHQHSTHTTKLHCWQQSTLCSPVFQIPGKHSLWRYHYP